MRVVQGKGQKVKAKTNSLVPFFLVAFAFFLVSGCAADNRRAGGDPLLGPIQPRTPGQVAVAPPPVSPNPQPPAFAPTSLTSNAALAAGPPSASDHNGELRIADPYRPSNASSGPAPGSGANLWAPEPAAARARQNALVTQGLGADRNARAGTFEQAEAELGARGVAWQCLETADDHGGWKFSCSVPHRQNRFISRTYEAQAGDPLAAVQAVLEQMDRER